MAEAILNLVRDVTAEASDARTDDLPPQCKKPRLLIAFGNTIQSSHIEIFVTCQFKWISACM